MKTSMYVAASMDGFIARANGDIDWLGNPADVLDDSGYQAFYETVDCLVMGNRTYQQLRAFPEWPYAGKSTWVYSRHPFISDIPEVLHVDIPPGSLIERLKKGGKSHLWILGGGEIHSLFLREGLIDEIRLFIMPVALGEGIPLFAPPIHDRNWRLVDFQRWNGDTVKIRYMRAD